MRSKTRPPKKIINKHEWNKVFIWWPRRLTVSEKLVPEGYYPAYCWVWCEYVERIFEDERIFVNLYKYRLITPSTSEGETTGK